MKTSVEYMAWARVQSASLIATSVEQLPPRIAITKRVVVVPPQLDENDEIVDADGITESSIYPLSRDEVRVVFGVYLLNISNSFFFQNVTYNKISQQINCILCASF